MLDYRPEIYKSFNREFDETPKQVDDYSRYLNADTSSIKALSLISVESLSNNNLFTDIENRKEEIVKEVNKVIEYVNDSLFPGLSDEDIQKEYEDLIEQVGKDNVHFEVVKPLLMFLDLTRRYVDDSDMLIERLREIQIYMNADLDEEDIVKAKALFSTELNLSFKKLSSDSSYNTMLISSKNFLNDLALLLDCIKNPDAKDIALEKVNSSFEAACRSYRYTMNANSSNMEILNKIYVIGNSFNVDNSKEA